MKVESVEIEKIKQYERNNKEHPPEQVAAIAASIQEVGWTQPIVVDENMEILAGHGRFLAAQSINFKLVPVLKVEGLTEEKKRLYRLADNRLSAEPEWIDEAIASELLFVKAGNLESELLAWTEEDFGLDAWVEKKEKKEQKEQSREVNFNIQYNIVFEDQDQQSAWFQIIRKLAELFPEEKTLGARLLALNDSKILEESSSRSIDREFSISSPEKDEF
jgi:hypothetical protein